MIIYDMKCQKGHRFEALLGSRMDPNPNCAQCGSATARLPSAIGLGGHASAGRSREEMPRSWQGINRGDAETVKYWHREMRQREKLEERYPEIGGDRRPVLAHEGIFAEKPLRLGDDIQTSIAAAVTALKPASSPTGG